MSEPTYQRLTRRSRGLWGFTQLWLAADHLLLVKNTKYNEQYQRFSLADIQAIIVRDGPDRTAFQVAGLLLALLWTSLLLTATSTFGKAFFVETGIALLVWVVVDFLRGPRCSCVLQTAVSRTVLTPISRTRQAAKFVAAVQPVIQAAQGSFQVPDPFQERVEPALTFDSAPAPISLFGTTFAATDPATPPALPDQRHNVDWLLFAVLVLTGPLVWAALHYPRQAIGILPTTFLAEFVLAGLLLVQGRANPIRPAFILAAIAAIIMIVDLTTVSGVAGWTAFSSLLKPGEPPADVHYSWLSRTTALWFAVGWRFAIGVLGLGAYVAEFGLPASISRKRTGENS